MKKKAIVILFDNFEEVEALAPVDMLRRAGVEVSSAALPDRLEVTGRSGITVKADAKFSEASKESYDAVILPGGAGVFEAVKNEKLTEYLKRACEDGKLVCAICAAPIALKQIGALEGKKAACHFSVKDAIGSSCVEKAVVKDANIITSRGAGTAVEFSLEIIKALLNDKSAFDVAKAICFDKQY